MMLSIWLRNKSSRNYVDSKLRNMLNIISINIILANFAIISSTKIK